MRSISVLRRSFAFVGKPKLAICRKLRVKLERPVPVAIGNCRLKNILECVEQQFEVQDQGSFRPRSTPPSRSAARPRTPPSCCGPKLNQRDDRERQLHRQHHLAEDRKFRGACSPWIAVTTTTGTDPRASPSPSNSGSTPAAAPRRTRWKRSQRQAAQTCRGTAMDERTSDRLASSASMPPAKRQPPCGLPLALTKEPPTSSEFSAISSFLVAIKN
jgi:hypothetical protein